MLFDKLSGMVEAIHRLHQQNRRPILAPLRAELLKIRSVVQSANLFDFPVIPGETNWAARALAEEPSLLGDLFFLPFSTVAVEDKSSCVLLQDLTPDARGLEAQRFFVDCFWANPPEGVFPDRPAGLKLDVPRGTVMVSWGHARLRYNERGLCETRFVCGGAALVAKRLVLSHALGEDAFESNENSMRNVQAAAEEIAYFNTPSRWVVEERTSAVRDEDDGQRIWRSHERPKFTVLDPEEIRVLFGGRATGSRDAPTPHARRRHFRTLRSDRYAKSGLQGKRILIPATWVGPEEVQVGNKRYIVRTDL